LPEFSQQHCRFTPYDTKLVTVLDSFYNCLVTVKDGQIRVVQAPRTLIFEGPVPGVRLVVSKVTGKLGGGVHLYADGHRWLLDFSRCYRSAMAKTLGGKVKLFIGLGGIKGIKAGKRLQEEFISAMGSQGAQVERE
jgi:hypothetical protein